MKTKLPLPTGATPEKPRQEKPFVQAEGELTKAQHRGDRWRCYCSQLILN